MGIRVTQGKRGKRYAARVHLGGGKYKLLSPRDTRKEAKEDEARWLVSRRSAERVSGRVYADRYLAEYREKHKTSSYDHAAGKVREWLKTFGNRSLRSITREESIEWATKNRWAVAPVVTMLNAAVEESLIDRNPLKGQGRRTRGRADNDPLTVDDVDRLADVAAGAHGESMRSFVIFTAYSGMRVGEVFALQWRDIDFERNRVMVRRRLYRGELDLPKSNKRREIALLPEAKDALLPLDRSGEWIFTGKRGGQMSQTVLTYYWQKIAASFGKPVTPHELRHFCGHHLYVTKGMEPRIVAAQLGHANGRLVEDLYGHGSVGALEQLEAAYEDNVRHLRVVDGEAG